MYQPNAPRDARPEPSTRTFHQWVGAILGGTAWTRPEGNLTGESFLNWLDVHRLGPIIMAALPKGHSFRALLRRQVAQAWAQHESRMTWLTRLLDPRHGIDWLLFKGLGSAHKANIYQQPAQRILGDVDLLVPDHQLPKAIQVASQLGFQSLTTWRPRNDTIAHRGYNHPMVHPDYGMLEIHFRLWGDIPPALVTEIFDRARFARVGKQKVSIVTSSDLLILASTHFWLSTRKIRWIWLYELFRLARSFDDENWDSCLQTTERHGLQVFLLGGILTWQGLWGQTPTSTGETWQGLWGQGLWGQTPTSTMHGVRKQLTSMLTPLEKIGLRLAFPKSGTAVRGLPPILSRRLSFRPTRDGLLGLNPFRQIKHPYPVEK